MIHWVLAHGKAMQKNIKQRIHLTKRVHECLPTLKHLNRQDNGRRTCPSCQQSRYEDRDHIMKCNSASRETWRVRLMQSLEAFHTKMDTYRPLRHLLRDAMSAWLQSEDDDMIINATEYHSEVRSVINQQNVIGWRQLINGRFGEEWSRGQDDYYARERSRRGATDKRSGQKWQIQLITHIWQQWIILWKLRNAELHGRNNATKSMAIRREMERELHEVYDHRHHYEPRVQELLCDDIQEQLQRPTWVTQNWLTVNAPLFCDSMRRVKNTAIEGVRSIRSYFAPIRPAL